MDADSCSMTPPLSPGSRYIRDDEIQQLIAGEQHQELDPVCWNGVVFLCKGEAGVTSHETFHPGGPLRSGSLNSHLKGGESTIRQAQQFVVNNSILFGYNFTSHSLTPEQLTKLFQFSKQWITQVEMFPATSLTQEQSDQLLTMRRHLKGFLEYLTVFVTNRPEGENMCGQITDGLRGLLLYLGDLSEKMSFVTAGKYRQMSTKCSHNFHMHLDVYWGVLQVLTKLDERKADKYPEAGFESRLTKEVVNQLLWQLVAASSTGYPKSAFPCCCVKELFVILIHILSRRHGARLPNGEGFWSVFNEIIDRLQKAEVVPDESTAMEVDSTDLSSPLTVTTDNPSGLALWLIVNLAPLFVYGDTGDYDRQSAPCSNYPTVQKLVKACVTSARRGEPELQMYLQWCVSLTHLWEPSVTLTMALWDHFSGQLNQNFQVASSGIEGLASMRKTPSSFLAECKRVTDREALFSKGGETSFSLFLHVLADTLRQFLDQGSAREWRQLKGRIFSKFHQRRMLELRETGLYNLARLFVTLTLVVHNDIHTVAGKLCDLYDLLDSGSPDTRTWQAVTQGRFCLCAIFLEKQLDISFMADKMSQSFNVVCSEYCQQHMDTMSKQRLWGMLSSYLENVTELLDQTPQLHLGQHRLIGDCLCETLPHLSPNELHRLLVCAINILNNVRSVHTTGEGKDKAVGLKEILAKMWKIFHSFLMTCSTTDTPPPEVADLSACLAISTVEIAEDNTSACASFQYFALKEDVNIRISLRYLDHVLESPSMNAALSQCLPNCSSVLIKVWLRTSLLCPQSELSLLSNINRAMLQQKEVMDVIETAGMGGNLVAENGIVLFFKALGLCYLKAKGLKEKIDVRNKSIGYCEDTVRFVTPVLRQCSPLDVLTSVYRVCGHMIRYCGPMLYIKSQPDCPLPTLIDRLVLPHSLLDGKKTPNPNLLTVLRETGHLFLRGLSLLDYQRDPYVKRRVRDIILQFLNRFPIKVSSGVNLGTTQSLHPAVSCLGKSLTKAPTEESSKFRQFVMTLIVENFLKVTSMTLPQNAVMGLSFVTEVFRRTAHAGEITRDAVSLLEGLLECSLLADNPAVRQHVNHLLQLTLEACAKHSSPQFIESLVPPVQRFVEKNVKLQPSKVFGLSLEKVAVFHPTILVKMLPSLTETVLNMERKRGVGVDRQLRDVYYKLLDQLGQPGIEEKLRLQTSG